MGVWWHALSFVTHERAKMSHKPGRNVTQAGPKCHTRAKMSHSHVIIQDINQVIYCDSQHDWRRVLIHDGVIIFSASLVLCEWKTPVSDGFSSQRTVRVNFDFFSLLFAWTRCKTNNWIVGNFRRHNAYVTLPWYMWASFSTHQLFSLSDQKFAF